MGSAHRPADAGFELLMRGVQQACGKDCAVPTNNMSLLKQNSHVPTRKSEMLSVVPDASGANGKMLTASL